jgi:hypothetical protein
MSILSSNGPGEDDGIGGVVTQSAHQLASCPTVYVCFVNLPRPSIVPKRFDVNNDRRGVGN